MTLAWAIGLALRPPSPRAPLVAIERAVVATREPRARSAELLRVAAAAELTCSVATSAVVTFKGLAEEPMSPLVDRNSIGPRLLVMPLPLASWAMEGALMLISPELEMVLRVRAPAEVSRRPAAELAEMEPVAATVRGVWRRRVTPVSEKGSVSRVPGVRVAGWLVVVSAALAEPMLSGVHREVLP